MGLRRESMVGTSWYGAIARSLYPLKCAKKLLAARSTGLGRQLPDRNGRWILSGKFLGQPAALIKSNGLLEQ